MPPHTAYYIALSRVPGIGPARLKRLLDYFGTVERAWHATLGDLLAAGLDGRAAVALVEARRTAHLDAELAALEKIGARAITWEDDDYPQRLRETGSMPSVLYVLGELAPQDTWAVGVVGTRRATPYGREATARLSAELAEAGITVVSGLPRNKQLIQ